MSREDIYAAWRWPALARQATYNARLLAQLFNICPRHLRRFTHKLFQCSPQQWLDEQRLKDAARLLEKDGLIKTVAFDLGFKSVSHFSNRFKLRYGISPSEFQKQVRFAECPRQAIQNYCMNKIRGFNGFNLEMTEISNRHF